MMAKEDEIPKCLRITFVTNSTYPPDFGGATIRLHRTFLRLRQAYPLAVKVLAMAGEETTGGWSEVDGIPVHRLRQSRNGARLFIAAGWHVLAEARRGADLVYALTTGRLIYISAVWARVLRMPLVVEFVNNNIDETPQRWAMARMLARPAALAIAISSPVADQFRKLGVAEDRIWVRPNPVETARFRYPSATVRTKARANLAADRETTIHLLVGGLVDRKNHAVAIRALEQLPESHRLIIVGPILSDERAYVSTLKASIRQSTACNRITLIPEFIPDIERFMYAADCLWMPSKEEGLGNVMLEALCCGVPCVISRELGLEQHVVDLVNGFGAAPQAHAWADAVQRIGSLIADHERRRSISEQSRELYDSVNIDRELWRHLCDVARRWHQRPT